MDQGRLAGRVGDTAATWGKSGERSDIDDAAGLGPPKSRRESSREQEWSAEVRFENAIPNFGCQRIKFDEGNADVPPRVIDENVDSTKMVDYVFDAPINRSGLSLIELNGVAAPPGLSHRFNERARATSLAYIRNRNVRARSGKSFRNCLSNVA
jgi:hypothetical protein